MWYLDTSQYLVGHVHGRAPKDLVVLHETVSPDEAGWADITGVEKYLASIDFGIHGVTDAEGHVAWARGLGRAVFWQAGGVNERSMGIEQVSRVMLESPKNAVRCHIWAARQKQLRATAKLLGAIHNSWGIPLRYSDSTQPGVTAHWDVSNHFTASEGHTDCWPVHLGGYYPMLAVINMARVYAKTGVKL